MGKTQDDAPEPAGTEEEVAPKAATKADKPVPPTTPDSQDIDWKKRYTGLSTTYQKLQDRFNALTAENEELLGAREELTQYQKTAQTELEKVRAELDALGKEKDSLTQQLTAQEAKEQRTQIILADYPDLAAFEARGLLPTADTPEAIKEKLSAFREALGASVDTTLQQKVKGAGASVVGTTAPSPRSKEAIYAELVRLAGSRNADDRTKYEALLEEWDELSK